MENGRLDNQPLSGAPQLPGTFLRQRRGSFQQAQEDLDNWYKEKFYGNREL